MSNDNKNPQAEAAAKAAADKEAAEKAAAAAAAPPPAGKKYPDRARVRTVNGGTMRHLHTNEEIDGAEKKIDIDGFAISQIEAGKWEIVND